MHLDKTKVPFARFVVVYIHLYAGGQEHPAQSSHQQCPGIDWEGKGGWSTLNWPLSPGNANHSLFRSRQNLRGGKWQEWHLATQWPGPSIIPWRTCKTSFKHSNAAIGYDLQGTPTWTTWRLSLTLWPLKRLVRVERAGPWGLPRYAGDISGCLSWSIVMWDWPKVVKFMLRVKGMLK